MTDFSWIAEHTERYLKDPEKAHDWDATHAGGSGLVPTLLLTTKGRKSGLPRSSPLLYQPTGRGFIVVASKGGAPEHPAWYLNLTAEPACEVQVGRFTYRANASTLDAAARAPYWEWMTRFWPEYETYQARTERVIPVVILEAEPQA